MKHIFLLSIVILALFPLYLMVNISLKDNTQFAMNPWGLTFPLHFENYKVGWDYVGENIYNTIFVAFTTVFFAVLSGILGAFFFARFKMPGSKILFFTFILLMMYPGVANMVPTFKLISSLGLYNSHWALIFLGIAASQPFIVFVLKEFISDLPSDYFDAARIDGCSSLRQIWHVVIPLSKPIIGTMFVLRIIAQWNNFVAPLIMIRDNSKQMISVSLLHLGGEYTKHWGEMMAGYTIASIPLIIIFIFSMQFFIRGLSEGGIKG